PEFAGLARGQVRKEDARKRGNKRQISLITELGDFAEDAVFKEDQAEDRPPNGYAERLQLVPEQQRHDDRSDPGINVVQVATAPLFGNANHSREGVEDYGHDG